MQLKHSLLFITTLACSPLSAFAESSQEAPARNVVWSGFDGFLDPDWKQDVSLTLGVKLWMNEWRRDAFFRDSFFVGGTNIVIRDSKPRATTSDLEVTPIPQLSARYRWLFVTASYYANTSFSFVDTQRTRELSGAVNGTLVANDQVTSDRYEFDVAAGVFIHPNVAFLAGYKRIRQDQLFTTTTSGGRANSTEVTGSELDISGPIIGLAASVPLGNGFGLYGNYAHGFMDAGVRDFNVTFPSRSAAGEVSRDASYDLAEVGFTYTHGLQNLPVHLPLTSASAYAGYRYQAFETDTSASINGQGAQRSDTTRGFVVGVNLVW